MDHKLLFGIFDNTEISNIPNPCISSLKEKTFCYTFMATYGRVTGTKVQIPEIHHLTHQILQYQQTRMLQT